MHQSICMKEGWHYGTEPPFFVGKWSDHYIRALSYMEGECYDEALADLHTAMKQKFQDSRTERYYGMRFMSYFPHREAGIIYYLTGRLSEAKKELIVSLSHHATVKASYFLQKTINQILLNQDIKPVKPTIQMRFPVDSEYQTNQSELIISGIVRDCQAIAAIQISNQSVPVVIPEKSIQFTHRIVLNHGVNFIQVKATNILDQECMKTIHIRRDQSGPLIVVKQFNVSSGFQCDIVDPSGVDRININGNDIEFSKDSNVSLHLESNGIEIMTLIVFDRLGNRTEAQYHIQDFNHYTRFTALNNKHSVFVSDASISYDSAKLRLSIFPHVSECIAYKDYIDLQGKAESNHSICDLIIQVKTEHSENSIIKPLKEVVSRGSQLSFNESIPLALGKNFISITVIDSSGKSTQEKLTIKRELSEVFKLKYRLGIEFHSLMSGYVKRRPFFKELFAFMMGASLNKKEIDRFPQYNWFHSALIDKIASPRRFRVFLSHELKDLMSDFHYKNYSCAAQPFSPPYYSALGDIFITNQGVEVVLKIIQKETSKIFTIIDTFEDVLDENSLIAAAKQLSDQLHNFFPLLKGNIINIEDNKLKVSFDETPGFVLDHQLIIFSEKANSEYQTICPFHNNTEFVSWAKVRRMNNSFCIAIMDTPDFIDNSLWAVTQ